MVSRGLREGALNGPPLCRDGKFSSLVETRICSCARSVREINFRFLPNQPESDCIYHFPIDLEPDGIRFAVPDQSEYGNYNLIPDDLTGNRI